MQRFNTARSAFISSVSAIAIGAVVLACSPADVRAPDTSDASVTATTTNDGASSINPSDASSAGGGSIADAAVVTVCQEYAYARCGRYETCSPTAVENRFGNMGACVQVYERSCEAGMTDPGSAETVATQTACIEALPNWLCPDFISNTNIPPACSTPGQLSNGSPCAASAQCESGTCILVNGTGCGTCTRQPQVGDSCATTGCGTLSCEGNPPRCVALAQVGSSCSTSTTLTQDCGTGLTCVGGTCQNAVAVQGQPCQFNGAGCDFYAGLACNIALGTCQTAKLAAPGDACGTVGDQVTSCSGGSCIRGTCVAVSPPGGSCDNIVGPDCMTDSRCVLANPDGGTSGVCVATATSTCH